MVGSRDGGAMRLSTGLVGKQVYQKARVGKLGKAAHHGRASNPRDAQDKNRKVPSSARGNNV